jgi:ABC-type lipoprotein export system ATPase subunit
VKSTENALVHGRDVARTFGEGAAAVVAVHDAHCVVFPGDHIAVMGTSGSGKSTLLHLLAGLDTPTVGAVTWPVIGTRAQLRPGPIGVVFQSPSLMPPLTVLENVTLPLLLVGVDSDIAQSQARQALGTLDLEELAKKLPEELSGGQAQRVAIARILASRPRLILADEPTGQLDHSTGVQVIDALVAVATTTEAGLLVNTHDPAVAERFSTRWTMADGRLTTTTGVCACSA